MIKQNKSILFIIQHLYNGGSEATVARLSLEFEEYYEHIHIATFFSKNDYPNSFAFKGKHHSLGEQKNGSPLVKFWHRKKFIQNVIIENKIDVVISFLFNADLINAVTSSKYHVSIVGIRTSVKMLIHSRLKHYLYKYIFWKADRVLVQNQENKNLLIDQFGSAWKNKVKIIPNMFDVEGIIRKSEEEKTYRNVEGRILTTLGRYGNVKGHLHLIKILGKLNQEQDEIFKLIIIGNGPLKGEYINKAASYGLRIVECNNEEIDLSRGDIFLIGFRSNPFKYIANSDLFVFSSYFEGSPNALAEAMIVGTPVISAKCPVGPSDLLKSKDLPVPEFTDLGVLMPVLDASSLAEEELSSEENVWKIFLSQYNKHVDQLRNNAEKAKIEMKNYNNDIVVQHWIDVVSLSDSKQ